LIIFDRVAKFGTKSYHVFQSLPTCFVITQGV